MLYILKNSHVARLAFVVSFLEVIFFIFLFYYISPLYTLSLFSSRKHISGKIYDCTTGEPVRDARISLSGVGWGFRGNQLVWDKAYVTENDSDLSGIYRIDYSIGTHVSVTKEGYLPAYYYTDSGDGIDIGLLSDVNIENKNERTYQCTLESTCSKTEEKDGVSYSWDSCANPDYIPGS